MKYEHILHVFCSFQKGSLLKIALVCYFIETVVIYKLLHSWVSDTVNQSQSHHQYNLFHRCSPGTYIPTSTLCLQACQ